MVSETTPVTVLSGTLEAGKTTSMTHLLAESGNRDLAVLVSDMGEIGVEEVVDTGRCDFDASQSAGWIQDFQEPHASAEAEHGVTSVVFEACRPFHAEMGSDWSAFQDRFPTVELPEDPLGVGGSVADPESHEETGRAD